MSKKIGKDVTSRKNKIPMMPPISDEERQELLEQLRAEKEEQRLQEEKPKFPKEMKSSIPGEIVEAPAEEHPFGDFIEPKVKHIKVDAPSARSPEAH